MIFNSQSAITDSAREAAWGEWYLEHLRIMATVPGVFSAQRFLTTHKGHPRSLAMYGVANAEVFMALPVAVGMLLAVGGVLWATRPAPAAPPGPAPPPCTAAIDDESAHCR